MAPRRALTQLALALSMAAAVTVAVPPAHTVAGPQRVGVTLAILLGTLIIPVGLTIGSARDSRP